MYYIKLSVTVSGLTILENLIDYHSSLFWIIVGKLITSELYKLQFLEDAFFREKIPFISVVNYILLNILLIVNFILSKSSYFSHLLE